MARSPDSHAAFQPTADETILFSLDAGPGLLRIPVVGGEVEQLTTIDEEAGEGAHGRATVLPDGDTVLFTVYSQTGARLALLSLSSREVTHLPISGSDPMYSPTGHIVYVGPDGTTLWAVGFDASRVELTSTSPVPVLENVYSGSRGDTGNFGLAENGSLVYLSIL